MENSQDFTLYQDRMQHALRAASTCVFEFDAKEKNCVFFENIDVVFGSCGTEFIRHDMEKTNGFSALVRQFCMPEDCACVSRAFHDACLGKQTTCYACLSFGKINHIWVRINFFSYAADRVMVVLTDISELKQLTESLRREVVLDSFTKLYNKVNIQKIAISMLHAYPDQRHALILIDLDDFKAANDHFGHIAGDQVLMSISERLKGIFRRNAAIGRFGGDEFLVFLRNICDDTLFEQLEQLRASDDNSFQVTKSVGVAIYPDHGREFSLLIQKADQALYQAKQVKNTCVIYCDNYRMPER